MEYKIIYSKRKTIAVQVTKDAQVIVRAPMRMAKYRIEGFVRAHEDWINRHMENAKLQMEQRQAAKKLSPDQIRELARQAADILGQKTRAYAQRMGLTYGRITIRCQKTRWGSCSSAGNLNYNCLLMLAPDEVQDYVVIHELCHRREMNHSAKFWQLVRCQMPDYEKHKKWLRENGNSLLAMIDSN